jgi:hypothetical protein
MAGADSTIRVNIVGDAKSFTKATSKAEGSAKGMQKTFVKAGALIAGAFAVDAVVDFGREALNQADRVADATGQLEAQLGKLADPLIANAGNFTKLGQSSGDMLELEKRLADIGTAAGISDEQLAPLAESSAEMAAAMALIDTEGRDANYWVEQIGKAGAGAKKPLQELGVNVGEAAVNARALADTGKDTVDALTEDEKAAARLALILEGLRDRTKEVTDGSGDLEQKQAELQAKTEELSGMIGGVLEPALISLVDWIISGIEGWALFHAWLGQNEQALREMLTPIARVADALAGLIDQFAFLGDLSADVLGGPVASEFGPGRLFSESGGDVRRSGPSTTNVYVQGGSPETIERAVRDAVKTTARRG